MITIEQIKAECRKAIEFGQNASNGPWQTRSERSWEVIEPCKGGIHKIANLSPRDFSTWGMTTSCNNAAHIVHARTFSPASARVVLERIKDLEENGTPMDRAYQFPRIIAAWEGQS